MNTATIPLRSSGIADPGRLQWAKWVALVAMVADHADLLLFERSVPWLHDLGAFAFPVFCLAFGIGLASSHDRLLVFVRLLVPALLAQGVWAVVRPEHPLNVLLGFALCALVAWLWEQADTLPTEFVSAMYAGVVVSALAVFGEGGIALPALVGAGYLSARFGSPLPILFAGAAWCLAAWSPGAFLAVVVCALWPSGVLTARRWPGALEWAYVYHLLALGLAGALLGVA